MNSNGYQFDTEWYLHTSIGCNRATYCIGTTEEDDFTAFFIGVSVCSFKDSFTKKTGRAKALGRAVQAIKRGEIVSGSFDGVGNEPCYRFWVRAVPKTIDLSWDPVAVEGLRKTLSHFIWKKTGMDNPSIAQEISLRLSELFPLAKEE